MEFQWNLNNAEALAAIKAKWDEMQRLYEVFDMSARWNNTQHNAHCFDERTKGEKRSKALETINICPMPPISLALSPPAPIGKVNLKSRHRA